VKEGERKKNARQAEIGVILKRDRGEVCREIERAHQRKLQKKTGEGSTALTGHWSGKNEGSPGIRGEKPTGNSPFGALPWTQRRYT